MVAVDGQGGAPIRECRGDNPTQMSLRRCPNCGSLSAVPITFGRPTVRASRADDDGLLSVGGRRRKPGSAAWTCRKCWEPFGFLDTDRAEAKEAIERALAQTRLSHYEEPPAGELLPPRRPRPNRKGRYIARHPWRFEVEYPDGKRIRWLEGRWFGPKEDVHRLEARVAAGDYVSIACRPRHLPIMCWLFLS